MIWCFQNQQLNFFFNMHTSPTDLSLKNWKNAFFLAVLLLLSPNFAWGLSLTLETICICYSWSNRWYSPKYYTQKNHDFGWNYPKFLEKSKMVNYQFSYFHIVNKTKKQKNSSQIFSFTALFRWKKLIFSIFLVKNCLCSFKNLHESWKCVAIVWIYTFLPVTTSFFTYFLDKSLKIA